MSTLFLLCGLPGTGKSTLARGIHTMFSHFNYFSLENTRRALKHSTYLPERNFEVYQKNYFDMQFVMEAKEPIIFDSNASLIRRRLEVIKLAKRYQYQVIIIECVCPEEIAKTRIENRPVYNDGLFEEPNTTFVYDNLKQRWIAIGDAELKYDHVHYFVYHSHTKKIETKVSSAEIKETLERMLNALNHEKEV
ncbi:ATP-binding protein [uncultured Kordia sp.]|uniref:AAA family ATPase n=1 Tax=uncultured Kordia sp. TaxID=507699 RepID=UPI0026367121|nr:ATP-binding protein [uncultured Kordia sp.]